LIALIVDAPSRERGAFCSSPSSGHSTRSRTSPPLGRMGDVPETFHFTRHVHPTTVRSNPAGPSGSPSANRSFDRVAHGT